MSTLFLKVRGGYGFGHALPVIGNSPAYCISWAGLLLGKDCVLPNAREDHEALPHTMSQEMFKVQYSSAIFTEGIFSPISFGNLGVDED